MGGTARDPATARRLVAEGATYLGVGPTFATTSKTGLPDPIGVDGVRAVVEAVDVPVIAIAGITAATGRRRSWPPAPTAWRSSGRWRTRPIPTPPPTT